MKNLFFAALLALTLTGCATAPAPAPTEVLVPVVQPCPAAQSIPPRPLPYLDDLTGKSPAAIATAYRNSVAAWRTYALQLEKQLNACK